MAATSKDYLVGRIEKLEAKVKALYAEKDPKRSGEWADWLADNHVLVVADFATELARRYGADEDLARAGALLHDIADVKMRGRGAEHEAESLRMARELMHEAGFEARDIHLVVDDAIRYHSCHGDEHPESVEGKILSTADSLAHLKTDFYLFATRFLSPDMTFDEVKKWTLEKIERDVHRKIFFDDVRQEVMPDYEVIKELFSR